MIASPLAPQPKLIPPQNPVCGGVVTCGVSRSGGGGFGLGGRAMLGPGAGRTSIGGGSGATCWLTTGGLSPGWGAGSGTAGGRGAVIFALEDG